MLLELFTHVCKATYHEYNTSIFPIYNQESMPSNEPESHSKSMKKSARKMFEMKKTKRIKLYADNCTIYKFDLNQQLEELINQMCLKSELFQNKFYNIEELIRITNIKKLSLDHYKDQGLKTTKLQRNIVVQKDLCNEIEDSSNNENIRNYIGFKTFLSVFKNHHSMH